MNPGYALGATIVLAIFWILEIIIWLVFAWAILSWIVFFMVQSHSFRFRHPRLAVTILRLNEILGRAARPILRPFQKLLPAWKTGGIDWSPMLLLLAIYMIRTFLRLLLGPILLQG